MGGSSGLKPIIFTADDFGLHASVNAAVEKATHHGVLGAASLMVGAPAAGEAVALARELPGLGVGLHLVLADGVPVLPPERIPDLVGADGRFDCRMLGPSCRLAVSRRVQHQFSAEIHAQFEAFAATGLALDHVNAHKHFHLHPLIAARVVRMARAYGATCVRLPLEAVSEPVRGLGARAETWATRSAARALRRRLQRAGLHYNDHIRGLRHTGHMTEARVLRAIAESGPGVTEIYSHPATCNRLTSSMAGYEHVGELDALTSPRVIEALQSRGLQSARFADLVASA